VLPADLIRVLDGLLRKSVAERYARAEDALRDLASGPNPLVEASTAPALPADLPPAATRVVDPAAEVDDEPSTLAIPAPPPPPPRDEVVAYPVSGPVTPVIGSEESVNTWVGTPVPEVSPAPPPPAKSDDATDDETGTLLSHPIPGAPAQAPTENAEEE